MKTLYSPPAKAAGLTLVEILTAMFVLVIGISGTLAIVMRSTQMATSAADRNNASILIPEAIADVKHLMFITTQMCTDFSLPQDYANTYMDTLNLDAGNPFVGVTFPYAPNNVGNPSTYPMSKLVYPLAAPGASKNILYWPMNPVASRIMGQFPAPASVNPLLGTKGNAYRALFKIEPHPDWVKNASVHPYNSVPGNEDTGSAFVGIYILTLTMYRDLDPANTTFDNSPPIKPVKRLIQVSDPVMVYLRDSKVR